MSTLAVPGLRQAPGPRASTEPRNSSVSGATYQRRRVTAVVLLVVLAFFVTVAVGRVGAEAGLEERVAGHVVVEPGQTLWDVAVATAPPGVDTRQQLADLRELNGIDGSHLDAWAVVLVPAR